MTLRTLNYGNYGIVLALLWVVQDLCHPPYYGRSTVYSFLVLALCLRGVLGGSGDVKSACFIELYEPYQEGP